MPEFDSNVTWQLLKLEGCPKTTIYSYIRKYQDCEKVKLKKNSGRTPTTVTPQNWKKAEKFFTSNPSITIAGAPQKLKIPISSLARIKLTILGFKARVKKPTPKYVKDQENRAKSACRKIYYFLSEKAAVIDDDMYVNADPQSTLVQISPNSSQGK